MMLRFLLVYCVPLFVASLLWWLMNPDTYIERNAAVILASVAFIFFYNVSDEAWKQTELEVTNASRRDPR